MNLLLRRSYLVRGVVQGVGFRPFVYQLATRLGLSGQVSNTGDGVVIEVEGEALALASFHVLLEQEKPPLALIDSLHFSADTPIGSRGFSIRASSRGTGQTTELPPDVAICQDCLREMNDPTNRRFRYPFINCTNCGPRFTIITSLPYDRPSTTMTSFTMCADCRIEYENPLDRRFHAQPIACPRCGPSVNYEGPHGFTQGLFEMGGILAVKGIGGFHLACDATNDVAVQQLRERKHRPDQPFAIMVANLEMAHEYCRISPAEEKLLSSPQAPIVLLPGREANPLSRWVAPGNGFVGLMLPYSPLHHLLIPNRALVMTSGNRSGEPIARTNEEARERLSSIADAFLWHDRPIEVVCDDSVLRVLDGQPLPIRRSRGYAPLSVRLPKSTQPVLAVGGEIKATFCLAQDRQARLSQHIGDMENLETLHSFEKIYEHLAQLFRFEPKLVVCDAHPGYMSTIWAQRFAESKGLPLLQVQHHHAHAAAVLAEHQREPEEHVIAVIYDGTGFGEDGAIWGGEVLIASALSAHRFTHLRYVSLPGGDAAIQFPARVALSWLKELNLPWDPNLPCVLAYTSEDLRILSLQLQRKLNCIPTSSMGRLFDAVASLLGLRQSVSYEAQAAIELEALATESSDTDCYLMTLEDPAPLWKGLLDDLASGVSVAVMARRVHSSIAQATVLACEQARSATGLQSVVLSGGVFQNLLLLSECRRLLSALGFEVLVPRLVPLNDGGLALGQAWVAAARKDS